MTLVFLDICLARKTNFVDDFDHEAVLGIAFVFFLMDFETVFFKSRKVDILLPVALILFRKNILCRYCVFLIKLIDNRGSTMKNFEYNII